MSLIQVHKQVTALGCYNYQKQINLLKSQLNTEAWQSYLKHQWDWQLIQLLKCGFPLDCGPSLELHCDFTNHKSATLFPEHVDMYISDEKQFMAIYGPYKDPPFTPSFHAMYPLYNPGKARLGEKACHCRLELASW